jgi:hypothetical protein
MFDMKRREFIALLGGAAAWPIAARGQQPAMIVIGLLNSVTARQWAPFIAAFLQGLNEVGFVADLRPAERLSTPTVRRSTRSSRTIPVRSLNGLEL